MTTTFDHLLAAYLPRVHRAALGWMGDEQEAREVAQEALLKAFSARDRYDAGRPFYPWLHRIVRNTSFDALARRKHRAVSGLDTERVRASTPDVDAALDRQHTRRRLHRALQTLSPEHREIIVLRHFEDLSYAEIGELLSLAEGTVMSRLYRARKALAAAMKEAT